MSNGHAWSLSTFNTLQLIQTCSTKAKKQDKCHVSGDLRELLFETFLVRVRFDISLSWRCGGVSDNNLLKSQMSHPHNSVNLLPGRGSSSPSSADKMSDIYRRF